MYPNLILNENKNETMNFLEFMQSLSERQTYPLYLNGEGLSLDF